jgi:predicted RNA-binding Zn ribbon-like protein
MSESQFDPARIEVVGGRLCLDFINTRANHLHADAREYLADYSELVRWACECVQGIDVRTARRLQAQAKEDSNGARRSFRAAMALRDLLHGLFDAIAAGHAPKAADLASFNDTLGSVLAHRRLVREGDGIAWNWEETADLSRLLWPIVVSAAEVLTADDRARLKRCPIDEGCGWLYYDDSKNASRRWCSMRTCGNTAKVRAHYRRQQALK